MRDPFRLAYNTSHLSGGERTRIPKPREIAGGQPLCETNHDGCAALGRVERRLAGALNLRQIDIHGRKGLELGDVGEIQDGRVLHR